MALISIVVPVYFNEESLPELVARLDTVSQRLKKHRFEFIFVDDGSLDNSVEVLKRLQRNDPRIIIVQLTRNFGSNTAILAGLAHAKGQCAGFITADLQEPPEVLVEMISLWEKGTPVVYAVRRSRQGDPFVTRFFAKIFNYFFKKFVFENFYEEGIGFFVADRKVIDLLVHCNEKNVHLIGLLLWSGFPFQCVYYNRMERTHGRSRWTFGKKIKFFIDAFTGFSYLPLRACLILGLILGVLSTLYALLIIGLRIFGQVRVPGWSALMVVILLFSAMQFTMLGLIGEYLWRNFDATRNRPVYVIKKIWTSRRETKHSKNESR